MSTRTPDHITLIAEKKTTLNTSYSRKGGAPVDLDRYPLAVVAKGLAVVRITSGPGTCDIRIYDFLNAVQLGEISFSNTGWQLIEIPLSGLATGTTEVQAQLKSPDGVVQAECLSAVMEVD